MYKKLAFVGFSYSLSFIGVECGQGECYDINSRTISPGFHFVPGPDTCTLCVCDNGNPKWCKAVLCSPPQDCKSFRVGNSCCEFICLDDTFGKGDGPHDLGSDFGLRLIAGAITAILCLSIIFFSIHRLRQRKIRGRQTQLHTEDGSIGFIAGSIRYLPECEYEEPLVHYSLWKPSSTYFPRGEAPPPYEEAVAAARVEAALAASRLNPVITAPGPSLMLHGHEHRTIPMTLATACPIGSTLLVNEPTVHQRPPSPRNTTTVSVATVTTASDLPRRHSQQTRTVQVPVSSGAPSRVGSTEPALPIRTDSISSSSHSRSSSSGVTLSVMAPPHPMTSIAEENDDYRSECENCNLSAGTITDGDCFLDDLETMTLHRRPHDSEPPNRTTEWTSLTLPTNCRRPTSILCNSSQTSARENWFSSMPQTSSESSEGE